MNKKRFARFLLKFLSFLAFFAVSFLALFLAFGYRSDPFFRHIQKTSIIDITNRYRDIEVFLDGKLETTQLPYEIKGVLPGSHLLTVLKPGVFPWKQQIRVRADVVTKVSDILLFPEDLTPLMKVLSSFVEDAKFFTGKDVLVVTRPKQSFMTVISLSDGGTFEQDEIQLDRSDLQKVDIFSEDRFLLTFEDGSHEYLDFTRAILRHFLLPPDVLEMEISPELQAFYFVSGGNLYRVPFEKLADFDVEAIESFFLRNHVEHFALGKRSLYFLSDGMLFQSDDFGKKARLLDGEPLKWDRLAFYPGKNAGFIILRRGDERFLYALIGETIQPITSSLQGDFLLNEYDQVLALNSKGVLLFYDANLQKIMTVTIFKNPTKLVSWFGTHGHFLFETDGKISLSDIVYANVYSFPLQNTPSHVFTVGRSLYFLMEDQLQGVTLKEE